MNCLRKERICAASGCNKSEPILDGDDDESKFELKWCSRCKVVRYCSKTCQKVDYKSHKVNCKNVNKWAEISSQKFDELQADPVQPSESYFWINLGSFVFDSADERPDEYTKAFRTLVKFKWAMVEDLESWEHYQVTFLITMSSYDQFVEGHILCCLFSAPDC
jgi:hypothetical protein